MSVLDLYTYGNILPHMYTDIHSIPGQWEHTSAKCPHMLVPSMPLQLLQSLRTVQMLLQLLLVTHFTFLKWMAHLQRGVNLMNFSNSLKHAKMQGPIIYLCPSHPRVFQYQYVFKSNY